MASQFARAYSSFSDFEHRELRKLDCLYESVDNILDEILLEELEEDERHDDDDGILFDTIDGY